MMRMRVVRVTDAEELEETTSCKKKLTSRLHDVQELLAQHPVLLSQWLHQWHALLLVCSDGSIVMFLLRSVSLRLQDVIVDRFLCQRITCSGARLQSLAVREERFLVLLLGQRLTVLFLNSSAKPAPKPKLKYLSPLIVDQELPTTSGHVGVRSGVRTGPV